MDEWNDRHAPTMNARPPISGGVAEAVAVTMVGKRSSEEVARKDSVRDRCESAYSWNSGRTTSTQKLPSHNGTGNEGGPWRNIKGIT